MSRQYLLRLAALMRELGFINGCLYAANKVAQKIFRRALVFKYYLYSQPVRPEPLLSPRRGGKIKVCKVSVGDPVLQMFPRPDDVFSYRFDQGAICLVAWKESLPVGYIWLLLGRYLEDEVRCEFDPQPIGKAAWDFDIYITPEERAGLCFARLWDQANDYLRENGYLYTASRVSAFNRRSQESHKRLGAQQVGTAVFFVLATWQVAFFTEKPFFHLSFSDKNYPKIRVPPAAREQS